MYDSSESDLLRQLIEVQTDHHLILIRALSDMTDALNETSTILKDISRDVRVLTSGK